MPKLTSVTALKLRGVFILTIAMFGPLAALAAVPVASDPIVELPKYVVTDTRELPEPEKWRYAEITGFEILTNASDAKTRRLLGEFQLFNAALGVVWPAIQPSSAEPATFILCGRGDKFGAVTRGPDRFF
jgi:hypothetical protein